MNKRLLVMIQAASLEQLKRFERFAARKMKEGAPGWGDIWLMAEGELVVREVWGENA